ncbi:acetolactate synthase 2 small subunit [Psychromonas sp. 14N.309.X.WAT.B.A12]|uniref:acetolactate synthase 2 small subunit n=1 Tax=unclassified Psychromonas TaxID=2614957 RepID=UPI0025AF59CE|nr:acetolactate synthase 2 small subunit [Psychromonas sp. 14N.309.X.WAT.B.A12]MDN2664286.1 acetolactate synthase 2 small subunit [Psychromonas sp. 14N.309.X.WAT.B.A12]
MNNTLTIEAKHSPEFLERLLRVCRHRGFSIVSINATIEQQLTHIELTVSSDREITLLTKQLDKVIGILTVTLLASSGNIKASA